MAKKTTTKKATAPKKATPAKKAVAPKKAAPAKKAVAPKKAAPAKKAVAPKKATPAKKAVAPKKAAPSKKAVAPKKAAPAKKAVAPKKAAPAKKAAAAATSIIARVDVGFGNALYVRGEGAGLSWNKGTALENTTPYEWTLISTKKGNVTFKFLINDELWAEGENITIEAGGESNSSPIFAW
jgi:hypothetical protein